MKIRSLLGDASLALLASHTPRPVPTYELPPLGAEVPRAPSRVARANGVEIAYDTFGHAGDPPLLLVMGLAGQRVAWNDDFHAFPHGR